MRRANLEATADYIDQSVPTTRRWAWLGYLPAIKMGVHDPKKTRKRFTYLFDLDEVDAWLEAQKTPGRTTRVPDLVVK